MRPDKRQRILAAATAVFAERDFHQALVSEVASRAGGEPRADRSRGRARRRGGRAGRRGAPGDRGRDPPLLLAEAASPDARAALRAAPSAPRARASPARARRRRPDARAPPPRGRGQRTAAHRAVPPRARADRDPRAWTRRSSRDARRPHRRPLPARRRPRVASPPGDGVSARVAVLLLLAVAAGCGGKSAAESPATTAKVEAVPITVANVAVRQVERTVSVVGTLAANAQAEVASEVDGQVVAIEADLGDRVTPGQVLARVRRDEIEARFREAEATLAKAVADEGRARPLQATGVISAQEYEQVRWTLHSAQARHDQLRIQLDHT